jgi:hypothetical protein
MPSMLRHTLLLDPTFGTQTSRRKRLKSARAVLVSPSIRRLSPYCGRQELFPSKSLSL